MGKKSQSKASEKADKLAAELKDKSPTPEKEARKKTPGKEAEDPLSDGEGDDAAPPYEFTQETPTPLDAAPDAAKPLGFQPIATSSTTPAAADATNTPPKPAAPANKMAQDFAKATRALSKQADAAQSRPQDTVFDIFPDDMPREPDTQQPPPDSAPLSNSEWLKIREALRRKAIELGLKPNFDTAASITINDAKGRECIRILNTKTCLKISLTPPIAIEDTVALILATKTRKITIKEGSVEVALDFYTKFKEAGITLVLSTEVQMALSNASTADTPEGKRCKEVLEEYHKKTPTPDKAADKESSKKPEPKESTPADPKAKKPDNIDTDKDKDTEKAPTSRKQKL